MHFENHRITPSSKVIIAVFQLFGQLVMKKRDSGAIVISFPARVIHRCCSTQTSTASPIFRLLFNVYACYLEKSSFTIQTSFELHPTTSTSTATSTAMSSTKQSKQLPHERRKGGAVSNSTNKSLKPQVGSSIVPIG